MTTTSAHLLLLGHGSHLDPNSSVPVHALASHLRSLGYFAGTSVGFWKEEPSLSRCLDAFRPGETVVAVPIFISTGYFVQDVIPRELGLNGSVGRTVGDAVRRPDTHMVRGIEVRYTVPVGRHPRLAEVIALRASEAGAGPRDAVAVLGHGTRRNPDSERNVFAQAERLRATGAFAEVTTVFMDQEPAMAGVFDLVAAERVFMVPLFIAEGWHVAQTIPDELALEGAEVRRGGRRLIYTAPVGTHPSLAQVVLEIVREALV